MHPELPRHIPVRPQNVNALLEIEQQSSTHTAAAPRSHPAISSPLQQVVITDIQMPFGSMVIFIVKWTLASIPALVMLFVIGFVFALLTGGFLAALFGGPF